MRGEVGVNHAVMGMRVPLRLRLVTAHVQMCERREHHRDLHGNARDQRDAQPPHSFIVRGWRIGVKRSGLTAARSCKKPDLPRSKSQEGIITMRKLIRIGELVLGVLVLASPAVAFCGFYVSKADSELFDKASQVVLARDRNRTVLTMVSDFQGDPTESAMVIPVPTILQRDQIHVGDKRLIDHLDAYSAPRLVEYFDENPCSVILQESFDAASLAASPNELRARARRQRCR